MCLYGIVTFFFLLWWAVCLDMYPGETRKHGKSDVIYAIWSIQSDGG